MRGRLRALTAATAIAACTALLFAPSLQHQFTNFDDDTYVTANPAIRDGLTWPALRWAFTSFHAANWHPLTWVSHALDVTLFGMHPAGHHATSVMLHAANAALLFLVLHRLTGSAWRSALAALLFGAHPLRVEPVAWVAERKEVLATFFGLATVAAYAGYVRRPGAARLALTAAAFSLSLLAKSMLVTLPALLLFLDFWPLGRLRAPVEGHAVRGVLLEKAPLLALAAAAAAATWIAQSRAGTVQLLAAYPLPERVANALVASCRYLLLALWPADLAVYYPHPGGQAASGKTLVAAAALALATAAAIHLRRRRPALLAGWLWYLAALLPVVGLVQVGQQAMADRYTYVPLLGIFVAVAWLLPDLGGGGPWHRASAAVPAVVALACFAALTRGQLGHWQDSVTLFTRAAAVTGANWLAHGQLGQACAEAGRIDEAIGHYGEALRIDPYNAHAAEYNHGLGRMLYLRGRLAEARERFALAARIGPDLVEPHNGLGVVAAAQGRHAEAAAHFAEAARRDPLNPAWPFKIGLMQERAGQPLAARASLEAALRLSPGFAEALAALGRIDAGRHGP